MFSKNFVLLVMGQICSLFANTILRFALSMYILELTGSAVIFAGLLAVPLIPAVILSPFGGILADRANRRNIMGTVNVGLPFIIRTVLGLEAGFVGAPQSVSQSVDSPFI